MPGVEVHLRARLRSDPRGGRGHFRRDRLGRGRHRPALPPPTLHILLTDPLRADQRSDFFPGEVNLRLADVVLISKCDTASAAQVALVTETVHRVDPHDGVHRRFAGDRRGRRERRRAHGRGGGGRATLSLRPLRPGAGIQAAHEGGVRHHQPLPQAVGSLVDVYARHAEAKSVLPVTGYGPQDLADLQATLAATPSEAVIDATRRPVLGDHARPSRRRASYAIRPHDPEGLRRGQGGNRPTCAGRTSAGSRQEGHHDQGAQRCPAAGDRPIDDLRGAQLPAAARGGRAPRAPGSPTSRATATSTCLAAYSAVNFGHSNPELVTVAPSAARQGDAHLAGVLLGPARAVLRGPRRAVRQGHGAADEHRRRGRRERVKVARKWGYRRQGRPRGQANIIVMDGNFHGRTITTIIASPPTTTPRDGFGPFTPGFVGALRRPGRARGGHRRAHRRGPARADPGRGRRDHSAGRLPARRPRARATGATC